jgi:DNA-binding IclR family transcriptional regulator
MKPTVSPGAGVQERTDPFAGRHRGSSKFNTARRALTIVDLVSRREGLTAKALARELGVSLSTCYCLINILLEEGYVEKIGPRKGYRLGPTVPMLNARAHSIDVDARVEPVVGELAVRSSRHAYFGLLSNGDVTVSRVESPPKKPPVEVVRASCAASHALAVGKILIAATGPGGIEEYVDRYGLENFTPRTITDLGQLQAHLAGIRDRGFATDVEEFSENLCCVAAPIRGENGQVEGAIGISTTARHFDRESGALIELVSNAAREASGLL